MGLIENNPLMIQLCREDRLLQVRGRGTKLTYCGHFTKCDLMWTLENNTLMTGQTFTGPGGGVDIRYGGHSDPLEGGRGGGGHSPIQGHFWSIFF